MQAMALNQSRKKAAAEWPAAAYVSPIISIQAFDSHGPYEL